MIKIRPFEERDWAGTWQIIEPVFRAGETYPFSPDITEEEGYQVWVKTPAATFVAVDENNEVHTGWTFRVSISDDFQFRFARPRRDY